MPRVRFKPLHGQDSVSVPDIIDAGGNPVYFSTSDDTVERDLSADDAAIALSNPNFVDAFTGKNPNFDSADPAPVAPASVPPAAAPAESSQE